MGGSLCPFKRLAGKRKNRKALRREIAPADFCMISGVGV